MPRIDSYFGAPLAANFTGGGTNYLIRANETLPRYYFVYIDAFTSDVVYVRSQDGGLKWEAPVTVMTGTYTQVSVWYNQWSGIINGLIHVAGVNSDDDDVDYRTIDTAAGADTLGTQRVVIAATSTAANPGSLSICVARGGNIYVAYNIDAGTEHNMRRTVDGGVNWTTRATPTEAAAGDYFALAPGLAADNQDMLCIFWDISATELSRKVYDDSANSWAETSIATGMTPGSAATAWPPFAISVVGTSEIFVAAWNATDAAGADLQVWSVSEAAIVAFTNNAVNNSTDDQGLVAVSWDQTSYHVIYCGETGGGETFNTSMNIYYTSTGSTGGSWSTPVRLTEGNPIAKQFLFTNPQMSTSLNGEIAVAWSPSAAVGFVNVVLPFQPRARLQIGI